MADFTGRKAMAQNLAKDGLRIRAAKFKNRAKYDRTAAKRTWKSGGSSLRVLTV